MLISKINALDSYISKARINRPFGTLTPEPKCYKCDFESTDEYIKNSNGTTVILTNSEIKAIKRFADKDKTENVALAVVRNPLLDYIFIKRQTDLITGKGEWLDITDYDEM